MGAEQNTAHGDPMPDDDRTVVIVYTDDLLDMLHSAFKVGATAVHEELRPDWPEDCDPEFGEAADAYVATLDFTETTRPFRDPKPILIEALLKREDWLRYEYSRGGDRAHLEPRAIECSAIVAMIKTGRLL